MTNAAKTAVEPKVACAAAIADCAIIGDCRTAAIVTRQGAINWLCLPHFSSPSVFGALLDAHAGGAFEIRSGSNATVSRRYLPGTNVLETTFHTPSSVLRVTDAMVLPHGQEIEPRTEILRRIAVDAGEVRIVVRVDPRPEYGRARVRLEKRSGGWVWTWGNEWLHLGADFDLSADRGAVQGEITLRAGDNRWLSLTYEKADAGIMAPLADAAQSRLDRTADWWQRWSARCRYDGPYREPVERSILVLKLLNHVLSGSVVAAPTTSLPESIGGARNWDYRFCWLRDAALTMRAFTGLGYLDEARAFFDWLLHATRLTWPSLVVLYDVYGRSRQKERKLDQWRGFCDSRPVRVGNDAHDQLQLDVYGAVCAAAGEFVRATGELSSTEARVLRGFGETVLRHWREPDNGIWEIRGRRRQYTFSKTMCWTALDVLARLAKERRMRTSSDFDSGRDALRDMIERRGFNAGLNSYVGVLDGTETDASLLLMGCLGYADPRSDRMRSTYAHILQRLGRNGLLHRYEPGFDGFTESEGAFGICSFWAIDNLAKRGDVAEANRSFERLMRCANDVGLFAEEIDVDTDALLGNFPQAYTHVGVINAALALRSAES